MYSIKTEQFQPNHRHQLVHPIFIPCCSSPPSLLPLFIIIIFNKNISSAKQRFFEGAKMKEGRGGGMNQS
jgi:hypothetical protein